MTDVLTDLVEIEIRFTYETATLASGTIWQDVVATLGSVPTHRVEVINTVYRPEDAADDASENQISDDDRNHITIRSEYETQTKTRSIEQLEEELSLTHHFWADQDPTNPETVFDQVQACDVEIIRGKWKYDNRWGTFSSSTPPQPVAIEVAGKELTIPDNVDVVTTDDLEEMPYREEYVKAKFNDEEQINKALERYRSGQPFAAWQLYSDFNSSAWYSSIIPNPGSADTEREKQAQDEYHAAKRAITLADRYSVPLLIDAL